MFSSDVIKTTLEELQLQAEFVLPQGFVKCSIGLKQEKQNSVSSSEAFGYSTMTGVN